MADADPMQMVQMLMRLAGSQGIGTGVQNYVPRTSVWGMNDPAQGFSLGQTLSQLGPMMQAMGVSGDMMMQLGFPQLASRLQSNAGANPFLLARQQQIMRETMRFGFGLTGQQISSGLGFQQGSFADQATQMAVPIMSIMAPEMASELMSALSPTTITAMGGRRMVNAAAMRAQGGQINSAAMDAMRGTLTRLGSSGPGGKFRNEQFTHGFNFDDFAAFTEFAADEGLSDEGFDRRDAHLRAQHRILQEKFGGRHRAGLDAGERRQLDVESQQSVDAEGLLRAGSLQAKIGRQLQGMTGLGTGETLAMMQQMGLRAGNEGESNAITKLLRELESLGQAAGTTTQNLLNAGRALQAQNGGSLLYNTQAAAMAAASGRYAKDLGVKAGRSVDQHAVELAASRTEQVLSAYGAAGYAEAEAKAEATFSEAGKQELRTLKKAAQDDPTGVAAQRLAEKYNNIMRGTGSAEDIAAFKFQFSSDQEQQVFYERAGKGDTTAGINRTAVASRVVMNARRAELGPNNPINQLLNTIGEKGLQELDAMFNSGTATRDEMVAKFGAAAVGQYMTAHTGGGSAETGVLDALRGTLDYDNGGKERTDRDVARMDAVTKRRELLQSKEGLNQGPLVRLAAGKIHSVEDAFESMGFGMSKDISDMVAGFGDEDKEAFISATKTRSDAILGVVNGNATPEQKAEARKKLEEAESVINKLGVPEKDKRISDIALAAVSGAPGTPGAAVKAAEAAAPAPTGNGQVVGAPNTNEKPLMMKVEIDLKMNGQTLEPGKAVMKIMESQGFRTQLVDGKQQ